MVFSMTNKYSAYWINGLFGLVALDEMLIQLHLLNDIEGAADSFLACAMAVVPAIAAYKSYERGMKNAPNLAAGAISGLESMALANINKPTHSFTYNITPFVLGISAFANMGDFALREYAEKRNIEKKFYSSP